MAPLFPWMTDSVPYVTVSGFKAHPTYIDLGNLRSMDSNAADQDRQLHQILMEASNWADNIVQMPLSGHIQTDVYRLRPDAKGRLFLYPDHAPVRQLLDYKYGSQPGVFTASVTNPAYVIESNRQIITQLGGAALTTWSGPLQFNTPTQTDELFVQWDYVAGFASGLLTASCIAGATTIQVSNPTGLGPGDIFRIWDPGAEEALVVASTFAPAPVWPPVPTNIPLQSPTAFAHAGSTTVSNAIQVSAVPTDAYLAVIYLAIDILQRYGSADNIFPGMPVPSATMNRERPSSLWVQRAMQLLAPFRDVR